MVLCIDPLTYLRLKAEAKHRKTSPNLKKKTLSLRATVPAHLELRWCHAMPWRRKVGDFNNDAGEAYSNAEKLVGNLGWSSCWLVELLILPFERNGNNKVFFDAPHPHMIAAPCSLRFLESLDIQPVMLAGQKVDTQLLTASIVIIQAGTLLTSDASIHGTFY